MKNLMLGFLALFITSNIVGQITKLDLLFEQNQIKLTDHQKKELDSLALSMKDGQRVAIYPLTHDQVFDRLTYAKTAKDQANEIAEYIETIGFKLKGIPSNFPSAHKGMSVRVNMTYYKPKGTAMLSSSLKSNYPEKPSQFFIIDPNKDTIIIGNEGTVLYIDAGSLMSNDEVKVELKEYYSLGDYMKNALPTTSNGKMIQTGGSMYLNATENNSTQKKVKIDQKKGIGVDFTLGKDDPEMQIFIKDPKQPNEMNWILPSKSTSSSSWVMTDTELDRDGNIISQETFTSKVAWEKHLQEEEEERQEEAEKVREKQGILGMLRIYNLGFINCDRFIEEPMSTLTLAANDNMKAEYFLVYKDIRGVMTGRLDNTTVSFGSVPRNRKATLIALAFNDTQAYYFESEIIANGGTKPTINLQAVDKNFIDKQLALMK
jgi:hypothetical protein